MSKDIYKSSRVFYVIEAAAEYFISLLITGAFLANLTGHLGFSDSLTAVLSSFVALGCSFQLFSIAVFRKGNVKRKVIFLHIINQLFFMIIYLVPFINTDPKAKTALFIIFLTGGYLISNILASPKVNWLMSLVANGKRGVFTSIKEMFSLIGGMAFNLIMGHIIDCYKKAGDIRTAFIICAVTIFTLMIVNMVTLILIKEKEDEPAPATNTSSIKQRFSNIITDKKIMLVIMTSVLWTIPSHITTSFFGTYQIKELGFSLTFVAILSIVYAAVRIPCSFVLGRYADKTSFASMLKICYSVAAVAFLVATFMVPSNGKVFYTVYYILFAASMGGINSAETNLIFDYVPPEKRSDALSVKQTIFGLCGFFATLAATPLVNYIQASGNKFFGLNVYAQQVLAFISFILTLLLILYVDKIILKIEPYQKEKQQ